MKALDDGNFAFGIFVDLQKAFDTVDHGILLSKLCRYGIHGLKTTSTTKLFFTTKLPLMCN